jgi:hypothetical protein
MNGHRRAPRQSAVQNPAYRLGDMLMAGAVSPTAPVSTLPSLPPWWLASRATTFGDSDQKSEMAIGERLLVSLLRVDKIWELAGIAPAFGVHRALGNALRILMGIIC